MDVDRLTPEQHKIFWEVLEVFPHASPAVVISRIDQGFDDQAIISQCADGSIPMEYDTEQKDDIELAIQLSMNPEEQFRPEQHQQQWPQQPDVSVTRVLHVGQAAPAAAAAYPLGVAADAAAPVAATCSTPAAAPEAPLEQAHFACTICHKTTSPTALCHWPINKEAGDGKEEDPRAHACCRKCINSRYLQKRIAVTSRVAIACLQKNCQREIHQDRLVDDALLKPALVQWMLGNTDKSVADAREANTKKELRRKREEEPEITEDERERLVLIIDHMDIDKFTCLVDLLPEVDFTWLLEHIDRGSIDTIYDQKTMQGDTVPKRKRRRLDKQGVTNLVEDRLKLETTFDCSVCFEETSKTLGVPCIIMSSGGGGDAPHSHDQHLFCGVCVQGHAEAAVEQASIVRAGLGLKCMQPDCGGVLIYAHIEPLLKTHNREILEEKIAAAALDAAAVNVERCQRCPFAAIVDLPIEAQQTFACRRCQFEYCRNCNREWSARHEGKTCEELNPEFIRRKLEAALSDGAMRVLQRCPSCNVAFEKNGGCNTMHCRCGKAFPYAGPKVLSDQERAAIIQQHVADAGGDESVVEEINKIR